MLAGLRKIYSPIFTKFGAKVAHWSGSEGVDFSGTLDHVTLYGYVGPYLRGFTGSNLRNAHLRRFTGSTPPPEMLSSKIINTISAYFPILSVTVLSRSIAFSFHLKRSVTLKRRMRLGSIPDPTGGAHNAPQDPIVSWGGGHPPTPARRL